MLCIIVDEYMAETNASSNAAAKFFMQLTRQAKLPSVYGIVAR